MVNTAEQHHEGYVAYGLPADVVDRGVDAQPLRRLGGAYGGVGGDEHFRRNASAIEACSAEPTGFHDGGAQVRQFRAQQHVPAARSQHDKAVVVHLSSIPGGPRRNADAVVAWSVKLFWRRGRSDHGGTVRGPVANADRVHAHAA
ncbi:hypothetical protein [Streptomyces sp.]|uniref:hypothetical protein n=1 Tax=Streptomyces sp. TaxID=1931 RepID=UPI002F409E44